MAVRKILRIGHPILRKKSEPVPATEIRSSETKKLIRDMFDTLEQAAGIGLAAPQIGILKQIVIVGFAAPEDSSEFNERKIQKRVLINPEITVLDAPLEGSWEGCLSIPEMRGYVERKRKIRVRWSDEKEEEHDEVITGYDAVVVQHECDHLNGVLYVDRLKDPQLFGFNDELDAADA